MPKKLNAEDTIETIWESLQNKRGYIAGIRQKMLTCQNAQGNAHVCIGVTGTGQKPCYRIFYRDAAGAEAIYGSYWDMHEALDNEHAMNGNWSRASMDFEAVDTLMRNKFPTPLTTRVKH